MRPDRTCLLGGADEVGMIVLDLEVVHRLHAAAVRHALDRRPFPGPQLEQVANLQHFRWDPTTTADVEGMLRRRLDNLIGDMHVQDGCDTDKHVQHALELHFPFGVMLVARPQPVPFHKQACLIVKGDWLWARDEHDPKGEVQLKRVLHVFIRVAPILNVHVANQIIETTAEHPFYVRGRGWIPAKMLEIGDLLQLRSGEWAPVEGVADSGRVETVYNFEIEDYHTYFVSATQEAGSVWAHNAGSRVYTTDKKYHDGYDAIFNKKAASQGLAQGLQRISPSRVIFRGMEVRATRKLGHLTEAQLRFGYERGVSPRNAGGGGKIILHHHRQQPQGPLIEMPRRAHNQSNTNQHPLGNSGGVGNGAVKGDFNNWRNAY